MNIAETEALIRFGTAQQLLPSWLPFATADSKNVVQKKGQRVGCFECLSRRLGMIQKSLDRGSTVEAYQSLAFDLRNPVSPLGGQPAMRHADSDGLLGLDFQGDHGVGERLRTAKDEGLDEVAVIAGASAEEGVVPSSGHGQFLYDPIGMAGKCVSHNHRRSVRQWPPSQTVEAADDGTHSAGRIRAYALAEANREAHGV